MKTATRTPSTFTPSTLTPEQVASTIDDMLDAEVAYLVSVSLGGERRNIADMLERRGLVTLDEHGDADALTPDGCMVAGVLQRWNGRPTCRIDRSCNPSGNHWTLYGPEGDFCCQGPRGFLLTTASNNGWSVK